MALQPMPAPPLDGVPPSPPGLGGGPRNPGIPAQNQGADTSGDMQVSMLVINAVSEALKLIDMAGQALPSFAGVSAQMQQLARDGLRTALQQGQAKPEPAPNSFGQGMAGMMQGVEG